VQRAGIIKKEKEDWGINSNDYETQPVSYAFMFLAAERTKGQTLTA
jgi:hypothetical protein